jgi:hypothetical protein
MYVWWFAARMLGKHWSTGIRKHLLRNLKREAVGRNSVKMLMLRTLLGSEMSIPLSPQRQPHWPISAEGHAILGLFVTVFLDSRSHATALGGVSGVLL